MRSKDTNLPPDERLPEQLNFKLSGLLQAADELAAKDVLNLGLGELPPETEHLAYNVPKVGALPPDVNNPEDVKGEE